MTDRYTAMSDFDGRVENRSVTDCIEPILQMRTSDMTAPFPLVDCSRVGAVCDEFGWIGLEVVAAHLQPAFLSVKDDKVQPVLQTSSLR